jgi:hypothetical protein
MRFILEHPWLAFITIAAIAFAFLWIGVRDGKRVQFKVGLWVFCVGVIACGFGLAIDTPTEHARNVINAFVDVAEQEQYSRLPHLVDNEILLVDHWKDLPNSGITALQKNIAKLHQKHPLLFNTILRFQPVEREGDVLVEISLLSRVTGIGTVPSRWRIIVAPNEDGVWRINSIDAVEIMGRSFR